jgi:hypothetical protein
MRKQWVALLSMLGLTGSSIPVQSQVLKGSTTEKTSQNAQVKTGNGRGVAQKTNGSSKLNLNQQTLRQQNQGGTSGGKKADPLTPSAYCNAKKAGDANRLTPPPPGGNQAVTKASNRAVTKGGSNQAVTKGANNQQITKGAAKGNAVQTTAAARPK